MGCSYYGYAIIGVEINIEDLTASRLVRNCSCDIDYNVDAPPKFCSNCSKPFLKDGGSCAEGYDEDDETLFGYKIIYSTDQDRAFVGFVSCETKDNSNEVMFGQLPTLDIAEAKETLKNALGAKFWDEKKFGLYSVLYCSY